MPELSKITLPSGTTYYFKDETARAALAGGTVFLGITTTPLTDGATTQSITVGSKTINAINGGIAVYQKKEFVYADADNKWHEFGDEDNLGDLAYKDDASGNFTPHGTVSTPTFSGTETESTGKFTPSGSVSKPTFSGTQGNVSVSGTPSGSISVGTGTANYTPQGNVSTPEITVTPDITSKYVATSATGGGSVTPGSAASCTLPTLTFTVENENLTIGWTAGSFTANTPTGVTLPSFSEQTIATGIQSAESSQPSFTGTGAELKFTGSQGNYTGTFTPAGSVSQPTFTGTEDDVTVKGTPSGTVSQPTFTGTQETVTVS